MKKICTIVFIILIIFCMVCGKWTSKQSSDAVFWWQISLVILAILVSAILSSLVTYNKKTEEYNELENEKKYKFIKMALVLTLPVSYSVSIILDFLENMLTIQVSSQILLRINVFIITPALISLMYLYFHGKEKNYINLFIVFILPILIYGLFVLIYPHLY